VVLPERTVSRGTVIIDGAKIAYAGEKRRTPKGAEDIDARAGYVCPGLLDVHFHGAGPYSLDPPSETSLRGIAEATLRKGVLHFVPGMMASEQLIKELPRLAKAVGLSRRVPGIHVEGPFVNPEKLGGIQASYVRPVDLEYLGRLQRLAQGRIVMMVFAPELEGAAALPEAMRRLGIVPCVGHTLATSARVAQVVGRRKIGVTHLFNAMSGVDHREPGAASYSLTHDNAYVELNSDGTHVTPEIVDLVWRAKPHDKIILISDAVVSAGGEEGEYDYMGRRVIANARGVYYKDEGTLVGSRCLLNQCVARFMRFTGAPVEAAVRMASLNPAAMLGVARRKGSLEAGKDADVVVFKRDFSEARVVFLRGERLL